MTKEDKALLDMLSYAEGTIGVSNNGYDVVFGTPPSIIVGWTSTTNIVHNKSWIAAGRYQFQYPSWTNGTDSNNIPLTIANQDTKAVTLINSKLGSSFDKTRLTTQSVFNSALNLLSSGWASLPVTSTIKNANGEVRNYGESYYPNNKPNYTPEKLFEIYKLALSKY